MKDLKQFQNIALSLLQSLYFRKERFSIKCTLNNLLLVTKNTEGKKESHTHTHKMVHSDFFGEEILQQK